MKLKLLASAIPASAILLLCIMVPQVAHAQVTFTFTTPAQVGNPGSTLFYSGTLTNTGSSAVNISNDSPSFNAPFSLILDDSPFFNATPFVLAPAGQSGDTFTGSLIDITLASGAPTGTYLGTFTILGGPNAGDQNTVASADFSATVQQPTAPVPEASSVISLGLLLTLGLGGMVLARRKHHAEIQA